MPDENHSDQARISLRNGGAIAASSHLVPTAHTFLMRHLQQLETPDIDELTERIAQFASRPRPYLPDESFGQPHTGMPQQDVEWCWIDPNRVLLKEPGTQSFIHDASDRAHYDHQPQRGPSSDRITGIAEFARRIAREHGEERGLHTLLGIGPDGSIAEDGVLRINVDGYASPLGDIFRIHGNGNHRLAALAALEVPCVPAEVEWRRGPFSTSPCQIDEDCNERINYRTLLHTFGVASYTDPINFVENYSGIVTEDWPFLIDNPHSAVESLTALENLAGEPHTSSIGRLPRHLFNDPATLAQAGQHVMKHLSKLESGFSGQSLPETSTTQRGPLRRFFNRR